MIGSDFKKYVLELAEKGKREDKRGLLNYRDIEIQYDISNNAEGSAIVTMGNTKVACGVKLETGTPYPDQPDKGTIIVNSEFAPLASPDFEPGPPDEHSIEVARVVDRGIRESGAINFEKLCIESGKKIWMVLIDMYIQNHDGNLIDACALAAMAAISKAKFPKYNTETERVDYHEHTKESLPIEHQPIACTIHKISNVLLVDATKKEEEISDARITITTNEEGVINAMQKGGADGFSQDELEKAIELSLEKGKELRKMLK